MTAAGIFVAVEAVVAVVETGVAELEGVVVGGKGGVVGVVLRMGSMRGRREWVGDRGIEGGVGDRGREE